MRGGGCARTENPVPESPGRPCALEETAMQGLEHRPERWLPAFGTRPRGRGDRWFGPGSAVRDTAGERVGRPAAADQILDFASGRARGLLGLLTALAVLGAAAIAARGPGTAVDPDLVRVLRFMALMKGGFALAAFVGCFWRLARPAGPWRTPIYVVGPPLMAAGAIGLWSVQGLPLAAGLHLGLLAVLAAALTDPAFLPDLSRLGRGRR